MTGDFIFKVMRIIAVVSISLSAITIFSGGFQFSIRDINISSTSYASLSGWGVLLYILSRRQTRKFNIPPDVKRPSRRSGFPPLLLLPLSIAAFFYLLDNSFLSDDWHLLNYAMGHSYRDILDMFLFKETPGAFIRPMAYLLWKIDYGLFGAEAAGYYFTDLLIHGLNGIILCGIVNMISGDKRLGFLSGLVFILFPLNAETVCWLSSRFDLLALMFVLLTFYLYLRYYKSKRLLFLFGASLSFILSLYSKESALCAPILVAGYYSCDNGDNFRENKYLSLLPLGIIMISYIIIRFILFGGIGGYRHQSLIDLPAVLTGITSLIGYFLCPINIANNRLTLYILSSAGVLLFSIPLLFSVLRSINHRKHSFIVFAAAVIIMLLPVINILPHKGNLEGTRYLYIIAPLFSAGIALLILRSGELNGIIKKAAMVMGMILILINNVISWEAASNLSKSTINKSCEMDDLSENRFYVFNLPDNYHGAYVFRNGFRDALKIKCGSIAGNNLYSTDEVMNIISSGRVPDRSEFYKFTDEVESIFERIDIKKIDKNDIRSKHGNLRL